MFESYFGAALRAVAQDLSGVIDVNPASLVVRYAVEHVEMKILRRMDGLFNQLHNISLARPNGTGPRMMRVILRSHPTHAQA